MELKELVKAVRIMESIQYEKTNINLAYKIMKFMRMAKDDVEFYDKTAGEIINKYALKDKKNEVVVKENKIQLDLAKQEEMNKEVEALNTKEIDFPEVKFKLSDFEGINFSAVELMSLEKFIIEE